MKEGPNQFGPFALAPPKRVRFVTAKFGKLTSPRRKPQGPQRETGNWVRFVTGLRNAGSAGFGRTLAVFPNGSDIEYLESLIAAVLLPRQLACWGPSYMRAEI